MTGQHLASFAELFRKYRLAMVAAADQKAADEEIRRELLELARKNELRRALSHSIINLPAMTG